jgi:hypothetical protein
MAIPCRFRVGIEGKIIGLVVESGYNSEVGSGPSNPFSHFFPVKSTTTTQTLKEEHYVY